MFHMASSMTEWNTCMTIRIVKRASIRDRACPVRKSSPHGRSTAFVMHLRAGRIARRLYSRIESARLDTGRSVTVRSLFASWQ